MKNSPYYDFEFVTYNQSSQTNPRNPKILKIQKILENSKKSQKTLESPRKFQDILENLRNFYIYFLFGYSTYNVSLISYQ